MKTPNKLSILLWLPLLLICCAREEPGIEGNCGQWLSNDTVAVQAVAVYGKREFFQTKESFWHVIVNVRNEKTENVEIRWVRGEFSGKGINPNMVWCPLFTVDSLPENLTVKGIVNVGRISQAEIDGMESGLDFAPRKLRPRETCTTIVRPGNPDEPSLVKIKLRFGDGSQSRPFLIAVSRSSESR